MNETLPGGNGAGGGAKVNRRRSSQTDQRTSTTEIAARHCSDRLANPRNRVSNERNSLENVTRTSDETRFGSGDLALALKNFEVFTTLGWQDIATRYRRSRVGAFWLTINMLIQIAILGLVFSTLFRTKIETFLPNLAIGIVVWGLISGLLSEGCGSLIAAQETILQTKLPLSTHVLRVLWRNIIIAGHNVAILPILYIILTKPIGATALLALPGLALLLLNMTWIMLILAIVCTRFRDVSQITQNFIQLSFYATPIVWQEEMILDRPEQLLLELNPFYHLLNIVRGPLLGTPPQLESWVFALALAAVGWATALAFFDRFRKRIPYWL